MGSRPRSLTAGRFEGSLRQAAVPDAAGAGVEDEGLAASELLELLGLLGDELEPAASDELDDDVDAAFDLPLVRLSVA